ncbi:uncharacterized protein LOC118233206 [Anguilla anguilla]|uniref:uncharacterized protein LOC118233206 n=1 Tax=Anguilla anguilla TaxID=7936 RepID=UPI0015AAFC2C|nr:uncharacterized protein LOC118233206 [Anguilla anguilla]
MVDEMLEILASNIEAPILEHIRNSQADGLELEESTDVAVIKQLDVPVRYLDKEGALFCQFLDLFPLPDGKANTIVTAIHDITDRKGIPQVKISGLGTDGAAVMTGCQNGAAKQLCDTMPWLVTVHCAAHHLALVCKNASETTPYMNTFKDHLQQLHLYFRNSVNRTAVLKAAATTLGICDLKVKEVKDSFSAPGSSQSVQESTCSTNDPGRRGGAQRVPCGKRLSKVFQKEDVHFLAVKDQVPVTIETIRKIKEAGDHQPPGSALSTLHRDLDNPNGEERGRRGQRPRNPDQDIPASDVFWEQFCTQVIQPYLEKLTDQQNERFHQLHTMGAFSVLGPQAARNPDQDVPVSHLKTLAAKFPPMVEEALLEEWPSFKEHLLTGVVKDKTQLAVMRELALQYGENRPQEQAARRVLGGLHEDLGASCGKISIS